MMRDTEKPLAYGIRHYQWELPVKELKKRFRDAERFVQFCRECPNFGRSWACPPFNFNEDEYLSQWDSALLVATKIVPAAGMHGAEAGRLLREVRRTVDARLLDLERTTGGRAFSYAGSCDHCSEDGCNRECRQPCRHPELVRPSLEAFGFDIGAILSDLFGIRLLWPQGDAMPPYLMLVTALFHNRPQYSSNVMF